MGSSPLTQGKLIKVGRCRLKIRLIPAHAGKTGRRMMPAGGLGAHPRSRGENGSVLSFYAGGGSSPLTRGKPTERGPARVRPWAHPRSRGENDRPTPKGLTLNGSSPLTRGKHLVKRTPPYRQGLIPAHAGKTSSGSRRASGGQAHPRSRGENLMRSPWFAMSSGSSPLTRGKPTFWHAGVLVGGLIPAHAGKTRTVSSTTRTRRAHPRSRGENGC